MKQGIMMPAVLPQPFSPLSSDIEQNGSNKIDNFVEFAKREFTRTSLGGIKTFT
jgi:hypothetical protein